MCKVPKRLEKIKRIKTELTNNVREQNTDFIETIKIHSVLIGRKYLNEDFQLVAKVVYILIFREIQLVIILEA